MTKSTYRAFAHRAPRTALDRSRSMDERPSRDHDVDVDVMTCSVCTATCTSSTATRVTSRAPLVPGHEISDASCAPAIARVSTRAAVVGIGWQSGSCGTCQACLTQREHLCTREGSCVRASGATAARDARALRCSLLLRASDGARRPDGGAAASAPGSPSSLLERLGRVSGDARRCRRHRGLRSPRGALRASARGRSSRSLPKGDNDEA